MTNTLGPLEGRYAAALEGLRRVAGEQALTRARVFVETQYLVLLSSLRLPGFAPLTAREQSLLQTLPTQLTPADFDRIDAIERIGDACVKATNHDVKAVEYFIKEKLAATSLKDRLEWVHFALTSEDVNSVSYALLISDALSAELIPALEQIYKSLTQSARKYARSVMLARTHGQPAVPTTFGKEVAVFAFRLGRQIQQLKAQSVSCKFSGATGAYNAHAAAFGKVNWPKAAEKLVAGLNKGRRVKLFLSPLTTQVDNRDSYAEIFDNLRRANMILLDLCQDVWRYVSDGWIDQRTRETEVGSSTMPQKVNPIDFENAEGNLQLADALLTFFSHKLPVSRLQRDLSDSTTLRNVAVAFGHALVAYGSIAKGWGKLLPNEQAMREALLAHPEVLAEALQTILRAEGVAEPYEKLKALTRGRRITQTDLNKFIDGLDVKEPVKRRLRALTPENYTGLAAALAGGVK